MAMAIQPLHLIFLLTVLVNERDRLTEEARMINDLLEKFEITFFFWCRGGKETLKMKYFLNVVFYSRNTLALSSRVFHVSCNGLPASPLKLNSNIESYYETK